MLNITLATWWMSCADACWDCEVMGERGVTDCSYQLSSDRPPPRRSDCGDEAG